MLRTRLFYGLLTLILLLWGVGAAALVLVRDANRRYQNSLENNYPAIKTARSFGVLTSAIDAHYLPALTGDPPYKPPDKTLFQFNQSELVAKLESLRRSDDDVWNEVLDNLQQSLTTYFEEYESFFRGEVATREESAKLLTSLSRQSQGITQQSENVFLLAEERLKAGVAVENKSANNTLFVTVLVIVGTAIAVFIYHQLVRHLVDPVEGLRRSIDEIRKGNFELTLPEPGTDSEFRAVATAFNDMAAELRLRRGETEERVMRTNLVNRAILEAIPSPVFVLGDDGRILQLNPAAETLTESLGVPNRIPAKIQRILEESADAGMNHLPEDPREALLFRVGEREHY